MQSHGEQVRRVAEPRMGCDDLSEAAAPARFARRQAFKTAVFGQRARAMADESRVLSGQVLDVSPQVLVLRTKAGTERMPMLPDTPAWRGGRVPAATLRHGDQVIVRRSAARRCVADRIWAQIGRVAGTIIERDGLQLLVDEGPAKGRGIVLIEPSSYPRILVRFPRLAPGYLIDVIGLRQQGFLRALAPATAQPPYRADHAPRPPLVSGHVPDPVSGTAVWHEPGEERDDLLGIAYPALDPETSCERAPVPALRGELCVDPHAAGPGCVRLPYLAVGSLVRLRNDCASVSATLPVTSCGAAARLFCDRCVDCGTSPKGRIADLTMAAFVQLGGSLEKGCFNATMTMAS